MIKILRKLSGIRHIYPFYHLVSDEPPAHVRHLFRVKTVREFETDLEFFLKYYEPADFPDILNQRKPSFHLSFDDGLRECYDIIAPILLKKGIPATFFVNSDFVDNRDIFFKHKASIILEELFKKRQKTGKISEDDAKDECFARECNYSDNKLLTMSAEALGIDLWDYLCEKQPYLTKLQLKELQKFGFNIGAHSASHPLFSDEDVGDQIEQAEQSLYFVREEFKVKNPTFAFPFTDDGVTKALFRRISSTYTFGTAGIKLDSVPTNIQRIAVERMPFAGDYVQKRYLEYILQKIVSKNKILRK